MRHGNEVDGASRIPFLRSICFRTVQCLVWVLSGTIPHPGLGSICFMSSAIQEHIAEISETTAIRHLRSGILEHECFVRGILHPSEGSLAVTVISLLLGPG